MAVASGASGPSASHGQTIIVALVFSACSSSLLLVNQWCVRAVPLPSLLAAMQFAFSGAFASAMMLVGAAPADGFDRARARPYMVYVLIFSGAVYLNMQSLRRSNVETIIVTRACCPLLVSLLEWLFLGRAMPSARSAAVLLGLVAGAAGYVRADAEFAMRGLSAYGWVGAYYVAICASDVFGKHIVSGLRWQSMWGPTMYTNVLSTLPMLLFALPAGELRALAALDAGVWTARVACLLLLSVTLSVAISFFGWRCRSRLSATSFTVLGVVNKLAAALGSALLSSRRNVSPTGTACLAGCLVVAAFYQQAPLRAHLSPAARRRKGE